MSIPDDGLPCVALDDPLEAPQLLLQLQTSAFKHPLAAQALFCALAAEGRAFVATPEGQAWRDRLVGSELLHRARIVLDLPGFSSLGHGAPGSLPTNYVDALFSLAGERQSGDLAEALFKWGRDDA